MKSEVAFSKELFTVPYGKFFLPPRKLFGKSIVGWLNILLIQWLFLRIWYSVDSRGLTVGWSGFVVPLTGWWSDYKWVGKWR